MNEDLFRVESGVHIFSPIILVYLQNKKYWRSILIVKARLRVNQTAGNDVSWSLWVLICSVHTKGFLNSKTFLVNASICQTLDIKHFFSGRPA